MQIPKGDYGNAITFRLKYKNSSGVWVVKNLAGLVCTLKTWVEGAPGTLLLSEVCTVTDAANGVCTFTPSSGDFDTVGIYKYEIECTSAGVVDSSYSGDLEVTESG